MGKGKDKVEGAFFTLYPPPPEDRKVSDLSKYYDWICMQPSPPSPPPRKKAKTGSAVMASKGIDVPPPPIQQIRTVQLPLAPMLRPAFQQKLSPSTGCIRQAFGMNFSAPPRFVVVAQAKINEAPGSADKSAKVTSEEELLHLVKAEDPKIEKDEMAEGSDISEQSKKVEDSKYAYSGSKSHKVEK